MRENGDISVMDLPLGRDELAWSADFDVEADDLSLLDQMTLDGPWNGPLVVSMPRTGSTLLGTILLLISDPPGSTDHVFDRYVHEPVAPLFWEDKPVPSILDVTGGSLGPGDIVQESAYQFANREIARWFLRNARQPIAFTMRHPQIAWPSRWRIMLREWLATNPADPDAGRFQHALDANDFSDLGDILTTRVSQPANGWYAFLSLLHLCEEEGIEFALIDNARFREDPDDVLAKLTGAWGLEYDDALTSWTDLEHIRPRIVMSDLALGSEYDWYYARTLGSSNGIIRTDQPPVRLDKFPDLLRGESDEHLTIDQAVEWYEMLLKRPEVL
jgi:hypothetical protein